ncbi:Tn3 family transposase [Spirillospora sp. CA-108201]
MEGQDQLAALGLVVNAVVLWNSTYLSAVIDDLRTQARTSTEGLGVTDADVARLSHLGHARLSCLGRYAITSSSPSQGLRPPRSSTDNGGDEEED